MKALGTGHSRGVLWRDCEVFAGAARRNCSCTAAPRVALPPSREGLAAHYHAFDAHRPPPKVLILGD